MDATTWPHLCSNPRSVHGQMDDQSLRTELRIASSMPSSSTRCLAAPRRLPVQASDVAGRD